MTAALKWNLISVDDYLAGELTSPTKHEYVGGVVHAMAGGRIGHNIIKGNTFGSLFGRLRGKPCQPFDSDTKIRIRLGEQVRFYYPDVSVVCRSNPKTDTFQDEPVVIFEVLSEGTRRIDMGEKQDAYLTIPALGAYVLIEQDSPLVVVYRRHGSGFTREVYDGLAAVIPLSEIDTELSLAEIYAGIDFAPGSAEE
jgi:Uma2 family endonuclease